MDIIKKLAQELAIKEEQAKAAVQLIDEGNTIPFIARYRKEMTRHSVIYMNAFSIFAT